jgi:hypothetical protein
VNLPACPSVRPDGAGRVIATAIGDSYTLALVEDDGVSVLVDISLCLTAPDGNAAAHVPAIKAIVSVWGYLESLADVRYPSCNLEERLMRKQKELPRFDQAFSYSQALFTSTVYLKAVLMVEKPGLDLALWRRGVQASRAVVGSLD